MFQRTLLDLYLFDFYLYLMKNKTLREKFNI